MRNIFVWLFFLPVALVAVINLSILHSSSDLVVSDIDELETAQTALVLGARVYENGTLSDTLVDRLESGLDLYEQGLVDSLLVSGDNGQVEYDEVNAMKDYLLARGVAPADVFMDHAGFDTYDSVYRAIAIFEVDSMIIVTQAFHLPRAVYIAESLGVEVSGFVADRQPYVNAERNEVREVLARVKAFLDVSFRVQPTFLGDPIPITGDGRLSWD